MVEIFTNKRNDADSAKREAKDFLATCIRALEVHDQILDNERRGLPQGFFSKFYLRQKNRGSNFGSELFLKRNEARILEAIKDAYNTLK